MKFVSLFIVLLNGFFTTCYAQKLVVAFEPFPPFIFEDGHGLTVDMLREIEKISDLRFDVKIMTYARAKQELQHERIDIAGHTPKNLETPEFYQYAVELDWQIETTSDLFSLTPKYLDLKEISAKKIATTTGNAGFLAEQMGVDASLLLEVRNLHQLVNMLLKGRIDVLVFERASVMTLLKQENTYGVYYQSIGSIPASMAVRNDEMGLALKTKLDKLICQLDLDKIFSGYLKYIHLPSNGKTSITTELSSN